MSEHHRPATPTLRFPPEPRRRRHRWLVVGLGLAAAALLAAIQGQPVTEPEPATLSVANVMGEVGESASGQASLPAPAGRPPAGEDEAAGRQARGAHGSGATGGGAQGAQTDATTGAPRGHADAYDTAALPPVLGTVGGLELRQLAEDVVVTGFHEASSGSHAIDPVGRIVSNENTTRFEPPADRLDGVDYHILSSRGRIHPPTSAVDIVLRDDVAVLAPVSGVVADVREYDLYGRHADHRIEIHPDEAHEVRVVLVHVDDVQVRMGDRVEAGITVLAGTANRFPFTSQIDRETEPDRWPHVHLEVQPIDAPRPGDDPAEG